MTTLPPGACPANPDLCLPINPRPAPRVPAGPNSLAAIASRRGLLGAFAAVPTLALPVMPALADNSDWHAAIRDWKQTRATWSVFADQYAAAETAYQRDPTLKNKEAEDRFDKLDTEWMEKDGDALCRIITTPAPDIEAVIYKLKLGEDHALNVTHDVIADIRRLTQEG
jgi:hypothetical protein